MDGPCKGLCYTARQGLQPPPRQLFCGTTHSLFAVAGDKVSRDLRVVWLPAWKQVHAGNDRFGRRPAAYARRGTLRCQIWIRPFLCSSSCCARCMQRAFDLALALKALIPGLAVPG